MSNDQKKILEMLKDGKISVSEADELLSAIGQDQTPPSEAEPVDKPRKSPKYLRIEVREPSRGSGKDETVNIRVPFQLIRAGMKMHSLIPSNAKQKIDGALKEKGIDIDIENIDSKNIEELVEALTELKIDVDGDETVAIYCE